MGVKDLPLDSGRNIARVFEQFGFHIRRIGNHITLTHPEKISICLSIPSHREVDRRLLHTLIRKAGLTDEEFAKKYKQL